MPSLSGTPFGNIGLASDMVGALLLFFFSAPHQVAFPGIVATNVDEYSERQQRVLRVRKWLVRCGLMFLIVGFALQLIGNNLTPSRPTALEAERFYIKDEQGKVRAVLGVGVVLAEGKDAVGFRLLGRDGTTRVQVLLRGSDDAPFVQLRDREEKVSAQMDMSADGTPGLALWGPRSGLGAPKAEISMSFKDPGLPYVTLKSKDDKVL